MSVLLNLWIMSTVHNGNSIIYTPISHNSNFNAVADGCGLCFEAEGRVHLKVQIQSLFVHPHADGKYRRSFFQVHRKTVSLHFPTDVDEDLF